MKVIKFNPPIDRVASEAILLEQIHQQIAQYAGVLTVVQVVGILEACKQEVMAHHLSLD